MDVRCAGREALLQVPQGVVLLSRMPGVPVAPHPSPKHTHTHIRTHTLVHVSMWVGGCVVVQVLDWSRHKKLCPMLAQQGEAAHNKALQSDSGTKLRTN